MSDAKVAIVTGATSGIGLATARGLAKAGYKVAICGRRKDKLDEIAAAQDGQDGQDGKDIFGVVCDVADPDSVADFFAAVRDHYGRVDVVFNNAGRSAPEQSIGDMDVDLWRDVVDTNLNGAFFVAREAFRTMRDQSPQGGRIINNGSISAHTPRPHAVAYNATKHAVSGLTKSISIDGRPFNISCGQIDIGNTATDMTVKMNAGMLQADGSKKPEPTFNVRHVVDAIVYMAGLPAEANVQTMTVMATNMPFIGRG